MKFLFPNLFFIIIPGLAAAQVTNDTLPPLTDTADTYHLIESFTDSTKVGKKRMNMVVIDKYKFFDSIFVVTEFYTKQKDSWKKVQEFRFENDDVTNCDVKFSDFNNDGLNDMTYQSNVAARSANEIRKLFIYNKERDRLVYIKNSDEYPNLEYNKELDCITAWLVYGGSSTVFFHLKKNRLVEFASIDLQEYREIYITDKNGRRKLLSKRKIKDGEQFIRYTNYDPLH